MPKTRFGTANASAKDSRPQCMSIVMGCRYRPKPCRMPIASVMMSPHETSTIVGVRHVDEGTVDALMMAFVGLESGCAALLATCRARSRTRSRGRVVRMKRFELAERLDQPTQLCGADASLALPLCPHPMRFRRLERRRPFSR